MLTISGIVLAYVQLAKAQETREPHKEYTMAGREPMRGSSGSFVLYSLLVKCQFKECSAAASSEPRVHRTFLYLLITLKVTRAMCARARARARVCVCVCGEREREREERDICCIWVNVISCVWNHEWRIKIMLDYVFAYCFKLVSAHVCGRCVNITN
jgi:hypothetical protein